MPRYDRPCENLAVLRVKRYALSVDQVARGRKVSASRNRETVSPGEKLNARIVERFQRFGDAPIAAKGGIMEKCQPLTKTEPLKHWSMPS